MPITRKFLQKLRSDQGGAALIEYTVLLGVITIAVMVAVGTIGGWVGAGWASLAVSL